MQPLLLLNEDKAIKNKVEKEHQTKGNGCGFALDWNAGQKEQE